MALVTGAGRRIGRQLALRLARDPALMSSLRQKLARNRETFPLFDTSRFVRHLETAYATMWQRVHDGERPQGFAVAPTS